MAYARAAQTLLSNNYYLEVWYDVIRTVNTSSSAQTVIKAQLRIYNGANRNDQYGGRFNNNGTAVGSIIVNGTTYKGSGTSYDFNKADTKPAGTHQVIYTTGEITINHNTTTGVGSFTIQGRLQDPVWWSNNYAPSNSLSVGLTTIDRSIPAVTISANSITSNSLVIKTETGYTGGIARVSYWDSKSATWNRVTTTAKSNTKTYSDLTPNTTYEFQTSYESSKNGLLGYSTKNLYTTLRQAPSKASASLGEITTSSMVVTASATAGTNSPITAYRFNRDGSWSNWQSSNSYTFTGLSSNTSYSIQTQAQSGDIVGPVSDVYSFKTDTTNPVVSSLSTTDSTQTSISVSVGTSAQAGVKTYTYYRNGTQVASSANSTYTYTGLAPKVSYTLKVVITDNKNRTAEREITVTTKSTVISGVTMTSGSKTQNSISVSVAVTSAQAGIKNYAYYLDGTAQTNSASNSYTFGNLIAGKTYTLKVIVTDNENNTDTHSISVTTKYASPVLSNPIVEDVTANGAKIKYTASSVLGWGGYRYKIGSGSWVTKTGTPQAISISGLAAETSYVVTIEAWNTENTYSTAITAQIKTLEDQWLSISKSGGAFAKANVYIVTTSGVVKIEKSKSKIIK